MSGMGLTPEQAHIQATASALLRERTGPARIRGLLGEGAAMDAPLWEALAALGFCGLMVAETHGGAGLGAVEAALVLEETGRGLAMIPFLETAGMAVLALRHFGDDAERSSWLPAIAAGTCRAAIVGVGARPEWRAGALWGEADRVAFAGAADLLVVLTRCGRVCFIDAGADGVARARTASLDETRPLYDVSFSGVAARAAAPAPARLAQWQDEAGALLAAEQVGGAQFCLDTSVEYATQRIQFGRQIGSFQAVKHMLADMMVRIEAARSGVWAAARAIDAADADAGEACMIARSFASEAFHACAGDAIQVHGGVGFTWEHHAHRYFKRARATLDWMAPPAALRERLAVRLLGEAA